MGLHRSGTTFLYECLSKVLPVAKTTIQHAVFYPQLISSYHTDKGLSDGATLEAYFQHNHASQRGNDNIELNSNTAEEYGWVLREQAGSFVVGTKTAGTLKDLVQKISYMNPECKAILLKNPWDITSAEYIAKTFPQAKFIFIHRNPLEILNSEISNLLYFSRSEDPLLFLLTRNIPEKRILFAIIRFIRLVTTEKLFLKLMTRALAADIASNLQHYEHSLQELPAQSIIETSYADLVDNTPATLTKICDFLQLKTISNVESLQGKRRNAKILPCVAEHSSKMQARLKSLGLSRFFGA